VTRHILALGAQQRVSEFADTRALAEEFGGEYEEFMSRTKKLVPYIY